MNKIICEICGTVYPDNATLCPICGYPRNIGDSTQTPVTEAAVVASQSPERVRGGKFSNSNVKKRNQPVQPQGHPTSRRAPKQEPHEPEKPASQDNRALVITVVVLMIAVVFVGVYIGLRFFWGAAGQQTQPTTDPVVTTEPAQTEPVETTQPCTDIQIADIDLTQGVEFMGVGRAWRLNVEVVPENTTDELSVVSSDESVATVNVNEDIIEIISVAPGKATITITCGAITKQFPVQCNFDMPTDESTEPTETTEETTEETTQPTESAAGTLKLNRSDITLTKDGETFTFRAGQGISNAQVTWSSSDESVATIVNGKVTAVGNGTATITATYNGEKATCIVRCKLPNETEATEATQPTESTAATEPSDPTQSTDSGNTWKISHSDVTIGIGESFSLTVKNSAGQTASIAWSGGEGVSISGNTITGTAAGTVTVTGTHEGKSFSCIVRVQ